MMLKRVWPTGMRIGLVFVVSGCLAFPQQISSQKKHHVVPRHSHQGPPGGNIIAAVVRAEA